MQIQWDLSSSQLCMAYILRFKIYRPSPSSPIRFGYIYPQRKYLFTRSRIYSHLMGLQVSDKNNGKVWTGTDRVVHLLLVVAHKISNIKAHQIPILKCFSFRLALVIAQFIEARCYVENEDVVGAVPTGNAPTTSEWSAIWLPTEVCHLY